MNLLDEQYTKTPFYGVRKMVAYLNNLGYRVGKDHVRMLLRTMGLEAIVPRRNTSQPHPAHAVYPYLLRGVEIVRPNQVWSSDITYIRLGIGFAYLTAVIDWFSLLFLPGVCPIRSVPIFVWKPCGRRWHFMVCRRFSTLIRARSLPQLNLSAS